MNYGAYRDMSLLLLQHSDLTSNVKGTRQKNALISIKGFPVKNENTKYLVQNRWGDIIPSFIIETNIPFHFSRCPFHQYFTFFVRKFCSKLKLFLAQVFWRKCAHKILVKLTTGFIFSSHLKGLGNTFKPKVESIL